MNEQNDAQQAAQTQEQPKETASVPPAKDLEQVEKAVDFSMIGKGLAELSGVVFKRRKTIADLLEKVKPELVQAHKRGVSFGQLAEYLRGQGIPVSVTSLRNYLNVQSGGKKGRRRHVRRSPQTAFKKSPKEAPKVTPGDVDGTPRPAWKKPLESV